MDTAFSFEQATMDVMPELHNELLAVVRGSKKAAIKLKAIELLISRCIPTKKAVEVRNVGQAPIAVYVSPVVVARRRLEHDAEEAQGTLVGQQELQARTGPSIYIDARQDEVRTVNLQYELRPGGDSAQVQPVVHNPVDKELTIDHSELNEY